MARNVVAIYDTFQMANDAVRELVDNGFPRDNISIIANNERGEFTDTAATTGDAVADETGAGAGVGAGIGAAIGGIGGLLVGLGALTIPGIGPVIAAGPLAVALSTLTGAGVGAVAGGVTGGLLGALVGLGIPEEEAGYYAEGVRRGGVLVTVQADEYNADQITSILNRHNPVDINERASEWRASGWSGYDPNAETMHTREGFADRDMHDRSFETDFYRDFDPERPSYRTHYSTYFADSGQPYSYYLPAYRYGYGLRHDSRYRGRDWSMFENDARMEWERDHPNTWERVKSAVRHAWEDLTD